MFHHKDLILASDLEVINITFLLLEEELWVLCLESRQFLETHLQKHDNYGFLIQNIDVKGPASNK